MPRTTPKWQPAEEDVERKRWTVPAAATAATAGPTPPHRQVASQQQEEPQLAVDNDAVMVTAADPTAPNGDDSEPHSDKVCSLTDPDFRGNKPNIF